jgi:D-alanyl-D-alanine carboxypeptidase
MTCLHLASLAILASCASGARFSNLDAELRERGFSGVVVVANSRTTELARAYGAGITVESCFNLASASKMFTLVAIEQLSEAGKLRKDDRVGTYVTSYPAAADVTIGQLLSHTGGLPAGVTPEFFAAIETKQSLDDMISTVAAPLEFAPGSRKQYSNIGFLVLGRVIEVASGEGFEHYVATHILEPAAMHHTTLRGSGCARPISRMAPDRTVAPQGSPAGGWSASADDLVRFARALRDRTLVTAAPEALGLGDRAWGPNRMIGHNGGAPGINAELWILNDAYTIVVLANQDPPTATKVADEIVTILAGTAPPAMGGKLLLRKPD